jgi:hypothetical protein
LLVIIPDGPASPITDDPGRGMTILATSIPDNETVIEFLRPRFCIN